LVDGAPQGGRYPQTRKTPKHNGPQPALGIVPLADVAARGASGYVLRGLRRYAPPKPGERRSDTSFKIREEKTIEQKETEGNREKTEE
jgi:hypothetical protein